MHSRLDLNLLVALDVLLDEESVSGAAYRLHLSGPAMSRTLARIRRALGDPVLVRSGRAMAPTPYALSIKPEVREIVERAGALFRTRPDFDPDRLERSFSLLTDDTLVAVLGPRLLDRVRRVAPGVSLRFLPEGREDHRALREGLADIAIAVVGESASDTRIEPLLTDDNVGVVRRGHPLLDGALTPERYAAADHVTASRRGLAHGPIDEALTSLGLTRRVVVSVPTFSAALLMAAHTDLVARCGRSLHTPLARRLDLAVFDIPLDLPRLPVAQTWHARHDADPAHRWLRREIGHVARALTAN
ncbi:LysR family transcriptional regulator [Microbispora sp. NEAU-D428]|uniref:LysR family transcriptional regulator n=1 Tax=Microbispora sitophila TaxID=2771537 RepID=UPI001869127E|nr:LysR family transcriptional regulator [Microbispora sitophila]MBE3008840.1 LysR family transcriptional regulator [Microbispora sitophila]